MTEFLEKVGLTSQMFTSIIITIVLCVLAIIAGRRIQTIPSGFQNIVEMAMEKLYGFFEGVMGKYLCKKYFPLIATFFIYILFSNYIGLLPAAGHVPGLAAPTSTVNCTAAMALVAFIAMIGIGIYEHHGLGYFKHWFEPFVFLFPVMILEDLVKPVSLTLRLYGNVFGEETVATAFFDMVPIGLPVIMQLLAVLMSLIQAFVFALLAAIYITEACPEEEEHL